ncbi:DMSO reductase [Halobaculum sp. WSA2]|uniref:DMSO reductase n=1 Tax=Halobaculum saliterrae TaxID=2073113 RepID=A0A6B0SN65_9EURY|nr:ethylbenzene dehydrogenase-related protein [Halobaculum saliterrae]MXR40324.1 DMSO reductase [Halobaculum saliterrae]
MREDDGSVPDRTPESTLGSKLSREHVAALALVVTVVASAALLPTLADARPAYEIPVDYQQSSADLSEPSGEAWDSVPAASVPLSSAGASVPAADETSVESVRVEVARTNERLYLRLSWADATTDTSTDEISGFADAVAVQLPANQSERPPIAMGSTSNRVNVWYWSGTGEHEALLAGGPGTTTEIDEPTLRANATHEDGRWTVVFSRSMASDRANVTDVSPNRDMDVALAVWNGSNMERSGRKATSEWYYLALGPDTGGPPYEAILWSVAGLAIVFTTLVTIEGIRRTRGE